MTTTSIARSARSSLPALNTSDDDMAKSNVPIVEIRPFDGGLRRFAVESLEPAATVSARFHGDTGDYYPQDLRLDLWERIEGRGIVARLRTMEIDGARHDDHIGTGSCAEAALKSAWGSLGMVGEKTPIELRRVARDLDAQRNPPAIE